MQTNFKTGLDRDRRGSTLVVVLALLAMLSILGLSFVLYSGSEKTSAENFSGAAVAKANDQPRPSTEILTRFASRRLLTGSLDSEPNSALYGGRHTLLANLVGRDIHPHSGRGVNVIEEEDTNGNGTLDAGEDTNNNNQLDLGLPVVDQNYDRQPDSNEDTNNNGQLDPNEDINNNGLLDLGPRLLELNDSPSANNGSVPSRPAPDVDYTAPDINSVFLAFNGMALDPYDRPVHVVIPSFARPQYHRQIFTGSKASPLLSWETSGSALHPFHPQMGAGLDTARRVLRPHPLHRDYAPNGGHRGPRYVRTKAEANLLGLSGPFPFGHSEDKDFDGQLDPGEDLNDNGILDTEAHHGVWTLGRWQPRTYYRAGQWVLDSPDNNATGDSTLVRKYFRVEQAGMSGNSIPNFGAVLVGNTTNSGVPVFRRFARFQPRYEFDADPDGDGIKEAVWLDLDFPVQSLGNGKRAIPLFAFTIYDADGLINLNTAGNTSGLTNDLNIIKGNSEFISRSNLGLSPAEINPLWALDARPNEDFPLAGRTKRDVFADHVQQFGIPTNQAGPNTWIENANMEWWFLQKGRRVTQPVTGSLLSWVSGRHGELIRFQTTFNGNRNNPQFYPQPGIYGFDDNNNRDEGEQSPSFNPYFLARERPFVHPLDFRGGGSSFTKVGSTWLPWRLPSNQPPNLPHGFLMYQNYQAQSFQMGMGGQVSIKWGQALQGALMLGSQTIPLFDEQAESVVDERNRQPSDRLFTAGENFFLQASHGDIETTDIDSRLANLMSYNLKINRRADTIRRRFTTNSWDSRDFGRPFHGFVQPPQNGPSSDRRRAWEFWPFSEDVDNDGQLDPGEDFNNNGQIDPYARNRFGNLLFAFPPRFNTGNIFCPKDNPTDPFRPALRRRLQVIANQVIDNQNPPFQRTDSTLVQRKLSLNHIVSALDSNGNHHFEVDEVFNRPLTVHPLNPGTTVVPLTWNVQSRPPHPPNNPTQQEWWARFDRQQMARDIYVLLYTLCGGNDSVNYTTTNDHANTMTPGDNLDLLYTTAQLREMAQFAVNVVDELDRDNVMTRFEYDKNLGNGWNLDDNAWTNDSHTPLTSGPAYDPDYPEDSLERGIVYGVEAQQLTLSEFLAVHSNAVFSPGLDGILGTPGDPGKAIDDIPEDHFATKHNDAVDQVFAYIELTNASPIDVPLDNNRWRIVIQPNVPDPDPDMVRQLTLRTNTLVEVGTRYTIGSTNQPASMLLDSLFKVKQNFNAGDDTPTTYPRIAPFFTNGNPDPDFLDLISSAPGNTAPQTFPFRISSGDHYNAGNLVSGDDKTGVPGSLLLESGNLNPFSGGRYQGGDKFVVKPLDVLIRLQRRVHPNRDTRDPLIDGPSVATAYDSDNPWVDVDRMVYNRTQAQWEFSIRKEDNDPNGNDPTRIQDELKRLKSRERPEPFDRGAEAYRSSDAGAFQYNSLGGKNSNSPTNFVRWQPHFDRDFASLIDLFSVPIYGPHEVTNKLDPADPKFHSAGQAKFLNPDFPDNVDPSVRRDNRWARLLNFLEIPDRTDQFLPDKRKYRVSGKINLNTVRHPEVLAALLDQRDAFFTQTGNPVEHLQDQNGELLSRDWWTQFIRSRDRYDPVSEFYLPGTGHSRPFRSLGLSRFGKEGIEHTLLRSIPMDTNTTAGYIKRRLFELGNQTQHNNRSIDHHTRHRLLARIAGNTTTRSNVFFVFMQVDWFEAHRDRNTGHVRVGARLEAAAPQRSFFVIDRTRALEILQPRHIPRNGTYNIGRVSEDINGNGQLDAGEDINNNGFLDPTTVNSIDPETLILYQRTIE